MGQTVAIKRDGKLLTERDTLLADSSIDWIAVRWIALERALVERDRDICIAAYGPILKLPAGVSQDNVAEWRRGLASKADLTGLKLTPFKKLYQQELRQIWAVARSLQRARQRTLDELRASVAIIDGAAA